MGFTTGFTTGFTANMSRFRPFALAGGSSVQRASGAGPETPAACEALAVSTRERQGLKSVLRGLGVEEAEKATLALADCGVGRRRDLTLLEKEKVAGVREALKRSGLSATDIERTLEAVGLEVNLPIGNGYVLAVALRPGQAMQLADRVQRVYLGLGWTNKNGGSGKVDLDASCIGFSAGAPTESVWYRRLQDSCKSIRHTGDIRDGSASGTTDMERLYVHLPKVPQGTDCLVVMANIFEGASDFSELKDAYIRLVHVDTDQELARLRLAGSGLKGNAFVFARLYRFGGGDGPWQLQGLGMPLSVEEKSNAEKLLPKVVAAGCAHPPGSPKDATPPSAVLPCVALAAATESGKQAAAALFDVEKQEDFSRAGLAAGAFTHGVDFTSLEPVGDDLRIGDFVGREAFPWAAGVLDQVDYGAFGERGAKDTVVDIANTASAALDGDYRGGSSKESRCSKSSLRRWIKTPRLPKF